MILNDRLLQEVVESSSSDLDGEGDVQVWSWATIIDNSVENSWNTCNKRNSILELHCVQK